MKLSLWNFHIRISYVGLWNLATVNWFACEQEMLLSINLSYNADAKMPTRFAMEMWIASGRISNRYDSSKYLTNQNQFCNPTQRSSGLWSQWFRWRFSVFLLPKRSSRFRNHWWCLLLQYVWWYCYWCWWYSRLCCILCRWRFLND